MPARKPKSLIVRHETAAEKSDRAEHESEMRPDKSLPLTAPARLQKHETASAIWRRLMRLYSDLDGEIVTRLDMDLLVDYCILMEQVTELDMMRKTAYIAWLQLAKKHEELSKNKKSDEALEIALKVVGAFDAIIKLDSRADRKRALLHQWRQSLYLTPRARAGVAPSKKDPEPPPDPMETLLNEVTEFMNGKGDDK